LPENNWDAADSKIKIKNSFFIPYIPCKIIKFVSYINPTANILPKMNEPEKLRIDKWLWAVRIYKTRTLATDACIAGKIKIDGVAVKPSYLLKAGQTIHINRQGEKWIYKTLKLIEKRVGAPVAVTCFEDLTPPEEKNKLLFPSVFYEVRDKGAGRPTKKDRREIDKFKDADD